MFKHPNFRKFEINIFIFSDLSFSNYAFIISKQFTHDYTVNIGGLAVNYKIQNAESVRTMQKYITFINI